MVHDVVTPLQILDRIGSPQVTPLLQIQSVSCTFRMFSRMVSMLSDDDYASPKLTTFAENVGLCFVHAAEWIS